MRWNRSSVVAGLILLIGASAVADPLSARFGAVELEPSGALKGLVIVATGGGPRERPQATADVRLDAVAPGGWRGRLGLRSQFGGPFEGAHGGVSNFNHAFQNLSPSLDLSAAYAELHLHSADLRAGVQSFAWGKLDGIVPTDVITPRDYHDPLLHEFEAAKVAIPAVQATAYPPDLDCLALTQLRVSLVYVPLAVPARLPLPDERWFPPTVASSASSHNLRPPFLRRIVGKPPTRAASS